MSNSLPRSVLDRIENGDSSAISVLPDDNIFNDNDGDEKKTDEGDGEEQIDPDEIDFSQSVSEVYPQFTSIYSFIFTLVIAIESWFVLLVLFNNASITQLTAGQIPVNLFNSYVGYGYFVITLAVGTTISGAYFYMYRAPITVKEQLETGTMGMALGIFFVGLLIYGLAAFVGPFLLIGILLAFIIGLLIFVLILSISPFIFLYGVIKLDGSIIAGSILPFVGAVVVLLLGTIWPSGLSITTESLMLLSSYSLTLLMSTFLQSTLLGNALEEWLTMRGEVDYLYNLMKTDISRLEADAPKGYDFDLDEEAYDPTDFETTEDALSALKEGVRVIDAYNIHQQAWKDAKSIPEEGSARTFAFTAGRVTHPTRCETGTVAKEAANLFGDVISVCHEFDFSNEKCEINTSILNKTQELENSDTTNSKTIEQLHNELPSDLIPGPSSSTVSENP